VLRLWHDEAVTAAVGAAAASYQAKRLALCGALSVRGLEAHGATGINVWVRVPDETRTVAALRDAGYAVAPGSLFRLTAAPGVRITISALRESGVEPLAVAIAAAAFPAGVGGQSR
jgi:DNA-binding transcriptional MocR family regulator